MKKICLGLILVLGLLVANVSVCSAQRLNTDPRPDWSVLPKPVKIDTGPKIYDPTNKTVLGPVLPGNGGTSGSGTGTPPGGEGSGGTSSSGTGEGTNPSGEGSGNTGSGNNGGQESTVCKYTTSDGDVVTWTSKTGACADGESGIWEGCTPVQVKIAEFQECVFCPLFKMLYNSAKVMAIAAFEKLADAFQKLLLIGFALYIAYLTLKQVSAFTKQDAPKYITEGLTMAFKVLIAFLLLANGPEVYRLGLEPLLNAGIELGTSFMDATSDIGGCEGGISSTSTTFYSDDLYSKIDCFLKKVSQEIAVMQALGDSLMCIARHAASGLFGMWDLTMFTTGLVIWAFAWLLCLAFAFYLIDTIIRLGIIGALLPFLIATWPFKITSHFAAKGWGMFLNAFFTFVFLGLVISVNIELAAQAITGGEAGSGGSNGVIEMLNSENVEGVLDVLGIGLGGFVFMLLCCAFGFKLCGQASDLAGEMSGASSSGVGQAIGITVAGLAKGAATTGAKWGWKGVKGIGTFASEMPSAGGVANAFGISGIKNRGSLGNDVRAVGDKIAQAPRYVARQAYEHLTPAGRRLRAARNAAADMDDDINSFNDDDTNPINNTPGGNNGGGNDLNVEQNQGRNGRGPNGHGPDDTPPSSGPQGRGPGGQHPTGSPDENDVANAINETEETNAKKAAEVAANKAVDDGKKQLDAQAENAAGNAQPGAGGQNGSGSTTPMSQENPTYVGPRTTPPGIDPASPELINDANNGAVLTPQQLASVVATTKDPANYEFAIKPAIEAAARDGVAPADAVAIAYLVQSAANNSTVANGIDPSIMNAVVANLRASGVDDTTMNNVMTSLQSSERFASTFVQQTPENSEEEKEEDKKGSGNKPTGDIFDQIINGPQSDAQELQNQINANDIVAMGLQQTIDELTKQLDEAKRQLEENRNDKFVAEEVKRLREEITRQQNELKRHNETNKKN